MTTFAIAVHEAQNLASGEYWIDPLAESDFPRFDAATQADADQIAHAIDVEHGFELHNDEPDFPGDAVLHVRRFYALTADELDRRIAAEHADRQEALEPFGAEWQREQNHLDEIPF